jgi:hypothetical protein
MLARGLILIPWGILELASSGGPSEEYTGRGIMAIALGCNQMLTYMNIMITLVNNDEI